MIFSSICRNWSGPTFQGASLDHRQDHTAGGLIELDQVDHSRVLDPRFPEFGDHLLSCDALHRLPFPASRVLSLGVPEVFDYVATHASALKAHKQSLKNREHNRQFRARLRGALKTIRAAIDANDLTAAKNGLKQTISLIDKMATKGIIHRNAAGRYKSRLMLRVARTKAA